jgi:UDP:flavonoid glycosyltransferase YjiC (YdhE family)
MSTHNGSGGGEYAVVWPRAPRTAKLTQLAERPESLRGKTIAELWDYIFRGDEIFPIIEDELARRFPDTRFVNYKTFGSTHGAQEREVLAKLPAMLKEHAVDAVISGIGC